MNEHPALRSTSALGNDAIPGGLTAIERECMKGAVAAKIEELFDLLRIDHANDQNTRDTPARVARMLVEETLRGRFSAPPAITDFDNVGAYDGLIVTGPLALRSTCAHHLMPIYGHVTIGIVPAPDGKIIGLSKYDRIVDHFAARLQIQEELVRQIERFIVNTTTPRGLAVRVSAVHMCKTQRGVLATHQSRMISTSYSGVLATDRAMRAEFLQECVALDRRLD